MTHRKFFRLGESGAQRFYLAHTSTTVCRVQGRGEGEGCVAACRGLRAAGCGLWVVGCGLWAVGCVFCASLRSGSGFYDWF